MDDDDQRRRKSRAEHTKSFYALKGPKLSRVSAPGHPPENTYRLQPSRIFVKFRAQRIVNDMLEIAYIDRTYGSDIKKYTREFVQSVRQKMMMLNYKRYKIVVTAIVGENTRGCGVAVASRALMYMNYDGYVSATFENDDLHVTLLVYFINFE